VLGLAISLAVPVAAQADAVQLYYERSVMVAADGRCHLFSPNLGSALAAATAQAHGAALRSGAGADVLDQVAQRAGAKSGRTPCGSTDIATAAARVRSAFDRYSKLTRMTYPGDVAAWRAWRASPQRTMVWKLSQETRLSGASAILGLAGRDGPSALLAVARFSNGAQPYSARLVLRDQALAPQPFLNGLGHASGATLPLASRTPPRAASVSFLPESRASADSLLAPSAPDAVAFRFPRAAVEALGRLDPREAVAVDFLFAAPGGDVVSTAYFEVGDFAAGRAFLTAAQR
jgi:hypothetical protein